MPAARQNFQKITSQETEIRSLDHTLSANRLSDPADKPAGAPSSATSVEVVGLYQIRNFPEVI